MMVGSVSSCLEVRSPGFTPAAAAEEALGALSREMDVRCTRWPSGATIRTRFAVDDTPYSGATEPNLA